jgi:hypothetical protein
MLLFALSWLALPALLAVGSIQGFERIEVPPWADSIAIPFFVSANLALTGYVVLTPIVWLLAVWRATPAANLWVWNSRTKLWSWVATFTCGLFVAFGLWATYESIRWRPWHVVPLFALWIYTALVLRASALSPRKA